LRLEFESETNAPTIQNKTGFPIDTRNAIWVCEANTKIRVVRVWMRKKGAASGFSQSVWRSCKSRSKSRSGSVVDFDLDEAGRDCLEVVVVFECLNRRKADCQ
jgi:hypothetical protein